LRLLGIDPGSLVTGYGVIEGVGDRVRYIGSGGIRTDSSAPLSARLKVIYDGLTRVIEEFRPEEAAIESIFHSHNVQSALKLGHARGVALLAVVNAGMTVAEYGPTAVKKAVVGSGRADKEQIQRTVAMILAGYTGGRGRGYDASDALAVALCHYYNRRTSRRLRQLEGV